MKLPELLKKAVLDQDWRAVCAIYTVLTGETLYPPVPKKKEIDFLNMEISEDILQELGINGNVEPEEDDDSFSESHEVVSLESKKKDNISEKLGEDGGQPNPKANDNSFISKIYDGDRPDFTKKKSDGKKEAKRESIKIPKQRDNKFIDNLQVATTDLKANNEQLQKLYSTSSGRVSRLLTDEDAEVKYVNVICSYCEQPDTVVSSLAVGYDNDPEENTYKCNSCCTPAGRAKASRLRKEQGKR